MAHFRGAKNTVQNMLQRTLPPRRRASGRSVVPFASSSPR